MEEEYTERFLSTGICTILYRAIDIIKIMITSNTYFELNKLANRLD
jgi:hypothetical protein